MESNTGKNPTSQHPNRLDLLFFFLAILFVVVLVTVYVSKERFFYFYDAAGYHGITADLAYSFPVDPALTLSEIQNSINQEYNYFFALPLIPFLILFGDHRLVYELSTALIYQLPYALALGAIASRLVVVVDEPTPGKIQFIRRRRLAFWITVFITLVNPTAWGPLLRGLPDVGAALLIALAVWIYLYDTRLLRVWQVVVVGILLALAVIFRRHFAYAVGAFYLAAFLQDVLLFLYSLQKDGRSAWRTFWKKSLRLGLTAGITLLTIILLAQPFLTRILTINYTQLYASYLRPWGFLLWFYTEQYSLVVLVLTGLGFLLGIRLGLLNKKSTAFILVFGVVALVVWNTLAGQRGMQYTLHFTFLVIIGLSVLLVTVLTLVNPRYRLWLAAPLVVYLVFNGFNGILKPAPVPAPYSRLLSVGFPPMVRADYSEVVRLVAHLRDRVPPGAPIYVVDSSYKMNADLLAKAEQNLYGRSSTQLNILASPIIDSRDNYPLESLLNAQYVIVSTPPQYHLKPEEHEVMGVTYEAFSHDWEIARDFQRLPETFHLAGGTVLTIYQRVQPTSPITAVRTFNRMRAIIGDRPGSQLDWISLGSQQLPTTRNKSGRFISSASSSSSDRPVEMNFLYVEDPLEKGILTGRVEWNKKACKGLTLVVQTMAADGRLLESGQVELFERKATFELPFRRISASGEAASNLVLRAITDQGGTAENACSVEIRWSLQAL